jgi:biotin carboxyl carrier protein
MSGGRHPQRPGLWITIAVLATGAGVVGGQDPGGPGGRTAADSGSQATLSSLDRQLRELERRLDAALDPPSRPPARPPMASVAGSVHKVRPRLPCWIEKVLVRPGQKVRQGEVLAELSSLELADAKTDFLGKTQRFQYEQASYRLHKEDMTKGRIPSALWKPYERDEATSRLEMTFARDQLLIYGLSPREVDRVKDETDGQKAHFALRSPIDGVVLEAVAAAGDQGAPGGVLFVIGAAAQP